MPRRLLLRYRAAVLYYVPGTLSTCWLRVMYGMRACAAESDAQSHPTYECLPVTYVCCRRLASPKSATFTIGVRSCTQQQHAAGQLRPCLTEDKVRRCSNMLVRIWLFFSCSMHS
jgi:hypothetical protein